MATPNEQMLISSILKNNNLANALKRGINVNMFYTYQKEFKWIEEYYLSRSRTPSMAAFAAKFREFRIKKIDADDTEHFSEEVKEDHKRRSTYDAMKSVVSLLEQGDSDAALSSMHSSAMKISRDLGLVADGDIFRDHDDILNEFAMRRERYELLGSAGIPTGFHTFDARTGGFAPGEFHIFAARPGQSKSFSMQKMAAYAALKGYTVQFVALEQPRTNVMARILSLISKDLVGETFDSQSLIQGHGYDPLRFNKLIDKLKSEVRGRLHVADGTQGKINVSMIAAQIERNKPDIVFVDHISLVGRENRDFSGVSEVADELTQLSNQYSIPIVAASQLNRQGAQNGADLDTLAESDKIGQNASGVVMTRKMSNRAIEYRMVKNRNGIGNFVFYAEFEPNRGIFKEVTRDRAKEIEREDKELEEEELDL